MQNETLDEKLIFRTKDIGEAATLVTLGLPVLKLTPDTGFYWFHFEDSDKNCKRITDDYWLDKLLVNPRVFKENVRVLKGYTSRYT